MKDYKELAQFIIQNVGGKDNVINLAHCVTRLRFKLRDENKANDAALKANDEILSVVKNGGQYMVVIGTHVSDVYQEVMKYLDLGIENQKEIRNRKGFLKNITDVFSSIIGPVMAVMTATCMLKGILILLTTINLMSTESGLYMLFNAIGDCFLYYIVIFVGYTSAQTFKFDPFLGAGIGAAMIYPAITGVDINIFGYIINVDYTYSLFPVIIVCLFASYIYKGITKICPQVLRSIVVPLITIAIAMPLGFILIGPAVNYVSNFILSLFSTLTEFSPIISGILLGGLFELLVVFGLHSLIVLAALADVMSGNPNFFLAATCMICMSIAAVMMAVYIRTKDKKLKDVTLPSFVSAIFGVTEPAVYGVLIEKPKLFIISCIGGAITGGLLGVFGCNYYALAENGIIGFTAYINPADPTNSLMYAIIAEIIGVLFSFIITLVYYRDENVMNDKQINILPENKKVSNINNKICSPVKGIVKSIETVSDAVFSSKSVGEGIAIVPDNGKVYSPCDGIVTTLFPTNHAIGILSEKGIEVLIHIGINTVALEGKGFTPYIKQGDKVSKGQHILDFDRNFIHEKGLSDEVLVIITNTKDYLEVLPTSESKVNVEDNLLLVL